MAANGRNAVHNDAYQSDTYRNSGPLGDDLRVFSQSIDGLGGLGSCGITIAFDKRGRLITTCISATTVELRLMDRDLNTVASHMLPPRIIPPGVNPLQSPGGAYFYVDNKDRAVVSIGRQIFVVAIKGDTLERVRTYDLSSVIPADDQLNSALPDWSGRLWFVTRRHGIVGALDPASGTRARHPAHRTRRSATRSRWTRPAASSSSPTRPSTASTPAAAASPRSPGATATTTSAGRSRASSTPAPAPRPR